ncbi:flagellar hook-length control protein FliK [Zestomonas carbonaria]|uniref:Flagellar hook-length control protein-like C-terminal domain-containing protein n=1 Tax=Zestomonas carbonaria TaxID=2762745 RepID=A0A7U7ES79_9GAMM|nr:flagellar hook-length control protein FliK [Pseudomonas carbonaria]CAD5110219.1 hypothetical protein PSEWESI4_04537 [Pseudomonas carbonaria]
MLQLMTQAAQPGAAADAGPVLPQGFAQAVAMRAEGARDDGTLLAADGFGEQLLLTADVAASEPPEVAVEAPRVEQPETDAPDLPSAEQWLSSMLDQRAVSIQARESGTARQPGEVSTGRSMAEPAALPVQANVPRGELPDALRTAGPAAVPLQALVLPSKAQAETPQALAQPVAAEPLDAQLLSQLERLGGHAGQASAANLQPAVPQSQALEQKLTLQAPEAKWGEQMLNALRDSVELQMRHNVQHASIRLDPPELGSLEIYLSHESGRLNVQISAAQGDVARLLQQTSERLRQELVGQNFVQVDVQVAADSQSGRQQARQERPLPFEDEPVLAARPVEETRQAAGQAGDVLVTV